MHQVDITKLRESQQRGERAQELLDNELLQEALTVIEREVVKMWGECPARDKDGKEALWQLYKTAGKFRSVITGWIKRGEMDTENLKHFEEQSNIKRMFKKAW